MAFFVFLEKDSQDSQVLLVALGRVLHGVNDMEFQIIILTVYCVFRLSMHVHVINYVFMWTASIDISDLYLSLVFSA